MKDAMNKCLWLIAICLPAFSIAQKSGNKQESKNELNAAVSYQSYLHYFGRADSLKSSGIFPTVGFHLKNGLYAQSNFIFIQNNVQSATYTGATLEGGYRFPQSDHFNGNIFYTQFLYKDKSTLVQSALKSQTGINLAYTNKIVNINGGADLKFSDKTDVGATFGLDHLFIITKGLKNAAIAIDPSVYAYAGTQQFSNTYLKKENFLGFPVSQQNVTENVTQFNILSYEASMPVVLVLGKFNASVIPAYVMPQNLATVAGRPDLSERGQNMFYLTISAGVRL
jgi:hypothetical protein